MSSYNPPSELITEFNSKLFNQPDETLSAGEINLLYLTKAAAATIYQTIAGMSSYLTIASAATIYQTIANMTNYVSRTGSVAESINGNKTFTGIIKSNNYDTETATSILNIGSSVTSGEIKIGRNKTSGDISIGTTSSQLIVYSPTSLGVTTIAIGSNLEARNIISSETGSTNHTLFTNMTSLGVLTIGNALSNNSINGVTTFNQAVSTTGILTANGTLKTTDIVPIIANGQQNIYYNNLTIGGTIFFGSTSRVMNIFGQVVMNNSCQFTNALQANDISYASGAAGTAKTIWNTLSTGGSITIGSATSGTTTNLRGGSISIGGSGNNLTIESPSTFNSTLKTDDITAITTTGTQNIYTTLDNTGSINLGSTTTGTTTNILGGIVNITGTTKCDILSPTLNLTASSATSIEVPNNLTGQTKLFSTVSTGDIRIGGGLTTGYLRLGQDNTSSTVNIFSRILLGSACYEFPDSGSSLGSYFQTGQNLLSTAYTTPNYQKLSQITFSTGIYRIDWAVVTNTTTAGVHSGYDYVVSDTIASSTPVSFTGSQLKSIFGGTYGIGTKIVIGSSFTFQSTTAIKTLYLNISSSYSSPWVGSWSGDISWTRIG